MSAVLDWDRIAVKLLGEEVARTAQVQFGGEDGHLDLDRIAAFVTGYRSLRPVPRADLADAVERLWWKRMSDYWIFEFHYDQANHGPDALLEPAERLLAGGPRIATASRKRSPPEPDLRGMCLCPLPDGACRSYVTGFPRPGRAIRRPSCVIGDGPCRHVCSRIPRSTSVRDQ